MRNAMKVAMKMNVSGVMKAVMKAAMKAAMNCGMKEMMLDAGLCPPCWEGSSRTNWPGHMSCMRSLL